MHVKHSVTQWDKDKKISFFPPILGCVITSLPSTHEISLCIALRPLLHSANFKGRKEGAQ